MVGRWRQADGERQDHDPAHLGVMIERLLVDEPAIYGLPDAPFNPWLHMLADYGRTLVSALATIAVILALLWLQEV